MRWCARTSLDAALASCGVVVVLSAAHGGTTFPLAAMPGSAPAALNMYRFALELPQGNCTLFLLSREVGRYWWGLGILQVKREPVPDRCAHQAGTSPPQYC